MKKLIADVKKATSKYEKELKLISDAMEDDDAVIPEVSGYIKLESSASGKI